MSQSVICFTGPGGTVRPLLLGLFASCLAAGCSCSETGIEGHPDSNEDPGVDIAEDDAPVPCQDRDGDGFFDAACGGNDCDDTNALAYPGAAEICNDGIDQDCDGEVDELFFMHEQVQLTSGGNGSGYLVWTGSEFGLFSWDVPVLTPGQNYQNLDPLGARKGVLASLPSEADHSRTPWNGELYGLFWIDSDADSQSIGFRTLTTEGLFSAESVTVTTSERIHGLTAVQAGHRYVVTWVGTGYELVANIVNASGVLSGPDLLVSTRTDDSADETLLWTGSEVGIFWYDVVPESFGRKDLNFATLSPGMHAVSEAVLLARVSRDSDEPSVSWTGSRIGITWENDLGDLSTAISYVLISPDGIREADNLDILESAVDPMIAWNGEGFGLLWVTPEEHTLYFDEMDETGTFWGGPPMEIDASIDGAPKSLIWTSSEYVVSWRAASAAGEDLYFARIGRCQDP